MTDCQCSECQMPARELYYFRCKFCQSVLVTSIKSSRPERCRCSGSWLTFSHAVTVDTVEEWALYKQGRVWNPHAVKPEPWTCARCGQPQTGEQTTRPDGIVCGACLGAEDFPPLRTPEAIEARHKERAAFRRDMEDRHERAYQQREEEHNTQ